MSNKTETNIMKQDAKRELKPNLRFPEFRDAPGWKSIPLSDVSVPVVERVGDRILTPVSISAGIGFVRQAEKFGRDISGDQYKLYTLVKDGDFVYNKGNSLKFPQGCVYLLQGWGEVAAPNVFICFRLKEGYSNALFQNFFGRNFHGLQLKRHITSSARSNGLLNISKEHFFGVELPIPSIPEQQRVAECLSSLDELIAAHGQKLNALKAHRKGLIQQLFPREGETIPHLRFREFQSSGEWIDRVLGEFITERNQPPEDGVPLFSLTIEDGVTPKTERYERSFLVKNKKDTYKVMLPDYFAYNPMNLRFGAIAKHSGKDDLTGVFVTK